MIDEATIHASYGTALDLLRAIHQFVEEGSPLKGIEVHLDDKVVLSTLVELGFVTQDDVTDLLGTTTAGRTAIGIKPQGVIDLPVEVAEVTGNVEETELLARYIDGKIKAIDQAITFGEAPAYFTTFSWSESYQHCALTLKALADEVRMGLHLPSLMIEGRVIPYNDSNDTGLRHAANLRLFFTDVHARNVKAGWWTDIETGQVKKRNLGELLVLCVTEMAEAFDAWDEQSADDKLPKYPGFGVEIGDLLIRLADIAGAAAAGSLLLPHPQVGNPGEDMFREIVAVAKRYEAIRKTPAAVGEPETADYMPAMDIAEMVDAKLDFNAHRPDHKIENRLKEDGKKT